jgi:hypothetical protein
MQTDCDSANDIEIMMLIGSTMFTKPISHFFAKIDLKLNFQSNGRLRI